MAPLAQPLPQLSIHLENGPMSSKTHDALWSDTLWGSSTYLPEEADSDWIHATLRPLFRAYQLPKERASVLIKGKVDGCINASASCTFYPDHSKHFMRARALSSATCALIRPQRFPGGDRTSKDSYRQIQYMGNHYYFPSISWHERMESRHQIFELSQRPHVHQQMLAKALQDLDAFIGGLL